jgi:hypothetical protein
MGYDGAGRDHFLSPNHKSEAPSRIICVDTESWTKTKDHVQRLRFGNAIYMEYDKRQDHSKWPLERQAKWERNNPGKKVPDGWNEVSFDFTTVAEFHDWLDHVLRRFDRSRTRVWFTSHNMAYDFPILAMDVYLSMKDWEPPSLFVPAHPFLYYTKRKGVTLRCMSTTNWYNWPLEKLAPVFGMRKFDSGAKDGDFDSVPDNVLIPYCRQDTRCVVEIMKQHIAFILNNDLGTVQPTVASQALTAFRHRFMPRDVPLLVHHRPNLVKMELEAYKGGRTETFRVGKVDTVYILDINSMYPSVMHHYPYPVVPKVKSPIKLCGVSGIPESWADDFIIARCRVNLKEPCLGVRREDDGKLVFPVGNVKCTLTQPEFDYLEDNPDMGTVMAINELAAYEQSSKVFTAYVDWFYERKCHARDPVTREESKLYLNGLYGKLGQRMHEEITEAGEEDVGIIFPMLENHIPMVYDHGKTYILSGNRVLVRPKGVPGQIASNSMPRIAAAVTAYSRLALWDVMTVTGLERVYYCDTDSVITDEEGLHNCMRAGLCDETALGKLKWEGPYDSEYLSPKHYGMNGHWKNKGIRKKARQVGPNSWEQDSFTTGMSRYRAGIMDGVKVEKVVKTVKDIVDKGIVGKDGVVRPLVFDDF